MAWSQGSVFGGRAGWSAHLYLAEVQQSVDAGQAPELAQQGQEDSQEVQPAAHGQQQHEEATHAHQQSLDLALKARLLPLLLWGVGCLSPPACHHAWGPGLRSSWVRASGPGPPSPHRPPPLAPPPPSPLSEHLPPWRHPHSQAACALPAVGAGGAHQLQVAGVSRLCSHIRSIRKPWRLSPPSRSPPEPMSPLPAQSQLLASVLDLVGHESIPCLLSSW